MWWRGDRAVPSLSRPFVLLSFIPSLSFSRRIYPATRLSLLFHWRGRRSPTGATNEGGNKRGGTGPASCVHRMGRKRKMVKNESWELGGKWMKKKAKTKNPGKRSASMRSRRRLYQSSQVDDAFKLFHDFQLIS